LLPALHAHLPCTTLLNSEECALSEKKKKKTIGKSGNASGGGDGSGAGEEGELGLGHPGTSFSTLSTVKLNKCDDTQ